MRTKVRLLVGALQWNLLPAWHSATRYASCDDVELSGAFTMSK